MGPDPRDSPSHPLKQHKKKIWDAIFIADFKTTEILGAPPEMGDEPCKQSARKVQEIQFLCAKNKRQEGVTQTPKDIGLNIAWPKKENLKEVKTFTDQRAAQQQHGHETNNNCK